MCVCVCVPVCACVLSAPVPIKAAGYLGGAGSSMWVRVPSSWLIFHGDAGRRKWGRDTQKGPGATEGEMVDVCLRVRVCA